MITEKPTARNLAVVLCAIILSVSFSSMALAKTEYICSGDAMTAYATDDFEGVHCLPYGQVCHTTYQTDYDGNVTVVAGYMCMEDLDPWNDVDFHLVYRVNDNVVDQRHPHASDVGELAHSFHIDAAGCQIFSIDLDTSITGSCNDGASDWAEVEVCRPLAGTDTVIYDMGTYYRRDAAAVITGYVWNIHAGRPAEEGSMVHITVTEPDGDQPFANVQLDSNGDFSWTFYFDSPKRPSDYGSYKVDVEYQGNATEGVSADTEYFKLSAQPQPIPVPADRPIILELLLDEVDTGSDSGWNMVIE